ncbi:MAG: hypothetical protein CVV44_03415 [Spirochaetae bacterium HGW-Spirochaetae-1]|jgi:hypothetical protein|nr:MAG: hypothetical protein CVV44_03415 [Spirochaetae bacterium HGW-Spirochaetae-1]
MILNEKDIVKLLQFPRPDMRRNFQSLDGTWKIYFAKSRSRAKKIIREWKDKETINTSSWENIRVPFCIESEASGIGRRMDRVHALYFLTFTLDPSFNRELVHIRLGAVDHYCEIYLNGEYLGSHESGYTPITMTAPLETFRQGENSLMIYVEDAPSFSFLRGKQSPFRKNYFVFYTPVSGIWQSVWLENTSMSYLKHFHVHPGLNSFTMELFFSYTPEDFSCEFRFDSKTTLLTKKDFRAHPEGFIYSCTVNYQKAGIKPEFWSPGSPHLYPVKIRIMGQQGGQKSLSDTVESFIGLRIIERRGSGIFLNGENLYQRLILNQGYYPDGWYSPVNRENYLKDIKAINECGFNGMRIHEKLEDPAFLFCCDAMGMLVWEEFPSFYLYMRKSRNELKKTMQEIVNRDFNHPSIITWVLFNETWGLYNRLLTGTFNSILHRFFSFMKSLDPGRLVIDNSGFFHAQSDIIDIHHYLPENNLITDYYTAIAERRFRTFNLKKFIGIFFHMETAMPEFYSDDSGDSGQPVIISEFGGFGFYETEKRQFPDLYREWISSIMQHDSFAGYCYTQFTDIEQEENGLFTFDRKPKTDMNIIKKINLG